MFKLKFFLFAFVCIVASVFLFGCTSNKPVNCTEEAKICPDGSSVGRVAPDCNFAPCPDLNFDYNFVEKERVVKIINSLQWVCVGKYCSGEENVSDDIPINGKIKIDLIDINNPCENNDCRFNGFWINLPTGYVGNTKKVFIDSNQSLIIENTILRFSKNTYDTHPGPYNSTYSISVYPQKNTLCSGYLCQKNSICYRTFKEQCMACGEMDQSKCSCRNENGIFPNLTECEMWGSGDVIFGGYCVKGGCDLSYGCIDDCNANANSSIKCSDFAKIKECIDLYKDTNITQRDIYKITNCRNGTFCERNNTCYEDEDEYKIFCEQIYKNTQCNNSVCIPSCYEDLMQKPQKSGGDIMQKTGMCYGAYASDLNNLVECQKINDYYNYAVDYKTQDYFTSAIIDLKNGFANYCVFFGSQYSNNETLCLPIQDEYSKKECYRGLAVKNSDFNYCQETLDPTVADPGRQSNFSMCIDSVIDEKIAEKTFEIGMCDNHIDEYRMETCVRDNPTKVEDCNKIKTESSKNYCILNYVKTKGNRTYCNLITDEIIKKRC